MPSINFDHVGVFNSNGLTQLENILRQPLDIVKKEISNITSDVTLFTYIKCDIEIKPLETRFDLAENLYTMFEQHPGLNKYKTDKGFGVG